MIMYIWTKFCLVIIFKHSCLICKPSSRLWVWLFDWTCCWESCNIFIYDMISSISINHRSPGKVRAAPSYIICLKCYDIAIGHLKETACSRVTELPSNGLTSPPSHGVGSCTSFQNWGRWCYGRKQRTY